MNVFEELRRAKNRVDRLESEADEYVRRVPRIVQQIKYPTDEVVAKYSEKHPAKCILGNHLIPGYFTKYTFTDDGYIVAGGMFSGSYGYYEFETVKFPVAWLEMTDEQVESAALEAWQETLDMRELSRLKREQAREDEDRQKYEELKARFES